MWTTRDTRHGIGVVMNLDGDAEPVKRTSGGCKVYKCGAGSSNWPSVGKG